MVLITEEYYEKALKLARDSFTNDEPINKSVGLGWSDDLEALWMSVLKQNISLMLINKENGDVMGFRTFAFESKNDINDNDKHDQTEPSDEAFGKVYGFLKHCEMKAHIYDHFGVNEIVHFFAISVDAKYRQNRLGSKLMTLTVDFLKNLGVTPLVIKAEGTSMYSQKIFQKLGFETILEIPYCDYVVDGKVILDNTGDHKSAKVFGKRIELT